jgi:hypothetical protein
MNPRIRELAEQAVEQVCSKRTQSDGQIERAWHPDHFNQVFGELIVRECADRVSKMVMRDKFDFIPQDPHSQGWNDAVEYASKELKKSLGVES